MSILFIMRKNQVDEQKNSQTQLNNNFISKKETNNQTKPKILFSQSFPINNPEIFQSQNKTTIELLNQQEYKENNNSATYVHFPEKINQEINNLTPPNNSDFRLPYPPPLPLNTQQQLMQMPDIKPNLIQSPPLNNPKEEHSLYVQGGMVQRQQTQQINDKLFESLNSATNGKILKFIC
uniref:Uncharacterized protein n=1 Tax=Meloidogyne hapla TaxID=6305 RepID=A0A1I8BPS2_MELHA